MKKHEHLTLLAGLLLPVALQAQTVNTGDLFIIPGTQFGTMGAFDNTATGTFINDGEAYIYSNFNNDGTVDFSNGAQGLTRFQGTAVQQLSGGSTSYFYDVLFDNGSGSTASFELSGEISIDNRADFNEGVLKNDGFGGLVVFEDGAGHISTYDGSHVDGLVQKNGSTAFEYPVGDGGFFRYAGISTPDNAGDVFTGKYFFENPDAGYPLANKPGDIEMIDNREYWTLARNAGGSNVMLTLSWDEGTTTPANLVTDPEAIHIVRWDAAQNVWVDEGGAVDATNRTVTTPVALQAYGVFTLARAGASPGKIPVYNAISANENGQNDYLRIKGVQDLANNNVQVYNRWGIKVFETNNYDTSGNVFRGLSDGRITLNQKDALPAGTYYYVLSYDLNEGNGTKRMKQSGFLYLNTE